MGLLDIFFDNKISEPVDQKPRTGFRNRYGEELSEYLTEDDVRVFNYAVDGNGAVTSSVADILDDARVYGTVYAGELEKLRTRLMRAGLDEGDASRLNAVVSRWAMGIKR